MLAQVLTNAKQRARQLAYAHKRTQHITAAADSAPDVNEAVVSARAVRAARRGAATSSTPTVALSALRPSPRSGRVSWPPRRLPLPYYALCQSTATTCELRSN